jgi:plasmid stabilization system protein ParE
MVERYEVVITGRAEESLEKIVLYLEEEVSYKTADKVRLALLETIEKLEKRPESNGILKEISDKELVFRRVIKWSYRIIYVIEESEKLVFVVEIDHIKRNPESLKDLLK